MLLQKTIITMSSNGRIFLGSRSLGWMTFYVIKRKRGINYSKFEIHN